MEVVDRKFCALCGTAAPVSLAAAARSFCHCPRCDLIFVPPAEHPTAQEAEARYRRHRNALEDEGYVAMLQRPIALLRRYGRDVRRVLDYGCGPTAVLVELLRREGYDASGYDPLFASAMALAPHFDAVTCVEVFEHFAEPRREIEHVVELLRPEGCLVVSTLFHRGPASLAEWWYARDATHVAFYSPATLEWICGRFGLSLPYCDERSLAVFQRHA
jgi:SAM-dependent methyltransferase